jgi:DHA2 family methylenomycin A resistance protein-like MFS transporter
MCLAGFALFTVASAACGLAPSIAALIAARAGQGVGAAMLGACTLILLSHAYPSPQRRARAIGLWALGASAALAAGPLAGGLLIAVAGWRAIFFVNLPLGALGLWLTGRYAAETPRASGRSLDLPGQALAIVTVAALAAAIEAGTLGWGSHVVLAALALAIVAGISFIIAERRGARPMLPPALFRRRGFTVSVAAGFAVNVAFYGLIFVVSVVLQRDRGFSPLATGLVFVPVMAAIMAGNVLRLGLTAGASMMTAGFAVMLVGRGDLGPLVAGLSLTGLGLGFVVPAITAAALGGVDASRSGIASGSLTAFRQTGSVLGVAVCGTLLAGAGPTAGLDSAAGLGAALSGLVLIISLGSRFSLGRRPTGSGPGRTRIFSRVRAPEPPLMSGYAGRLGDTNPGEDASGWHRTPGGQQAWRPPGAGAAAHERGKAVGAGAPLWRNEA